MFYIKDKKEKVEEKVRVLSSVHRLDFLLPCFSGLKWRLSFRQFPGVCSVWFGSISVTANLWHGFQVVWDRDVPRLCIASPGSQAFYCKTGLLPSVFFFCVLSGCIVCCSICISYLRSVSCSLTKWEGLSLIHGWVFTVWVLECTLQPS